jgi:hypothetical protein
MENSWKSELLVIEPPHGSSPIGGINAMCAVSLSQTELMLGLLVSHTSVKVIASSNTVHMG